MIGEAITYVKTFACIGSSLTNRISYSKEYHTSILGLSKYFRECDGESYYTRISHPREKILFQQLSLCPSSCWPFQNLSCKKIVSYYPIWSCNLSRMHTRSDESGGLETGRSTNGRSERRPCVIHIRVCVRIVNRVSSGYYLRW